jgi:hypothetical protein
MAPSFIEDEERTASLPQSLAPRPGVPLERKGSPEHDAPLVVHLSETVEEEAFAAAVAKERRPKPLAGRRGQRGVDSCR